jgi:hypothetical protein
MNWVSRVLVAGLLSVGWSFHSLGAEPSASTNEAEVIHFDNDRYELKLDTSETPDLKEWADTEIIPMTKEWYPKLVALLPSPGFEAPTNVTIRFRKDMRGVAATGGNRISCAADWFRKNLKGEAKGAILHELVHVVQDYGWGRRHNPDASRNPGWLVEGIADYIRWYKFEPESKGAQITARNFNRARFDGNYRITANFLDWVSQKNPDLVTKLNAAAREGKYSEDLWKKYTGSTLSELDAAWRKANAERLGLDKQVLDTKGTGAVSSSTSK